MSAVIAIGYQQELLPPNLEPCDDQAEGRIEVSRLKALAERINTHHAAAEREQRTSLTEGMEAGRLLLEAKAHLKRGQWSDWLKREFNGHPKTARNYMRLAKRREELEAQNGNVAVWSMRQAFKVIAEIDREGDESEGEISQEDGCPEDVFSRIDLSVTDLAPLSAIQSKVVADETHQLYWDCCDEVCELNRRIPVVVDRVTVRILALLTIRDLVEGTIGHRDVRKRMRMNGLLEDWGTLDFEGQTRLRIREAIDAYAEKQTRSVGIMALIEKGSSLVEGDL